MAQVDKNRSTRFLVLVGSGHIPTKVDFGRFGLVLATWGANRPQERVLRSTIDLRRHWSMVWACFHALPLPQPPHAAGQGGELRHTHTQPHPRFQLGSRPGQRGRWKYGCLRPTWGRGTGLCGLFAPPMIASGPSRQKSINSIFGASGQWAYSD